MIGSYLTDIIKIVSTVADKYGKITETQSAEIKARVEDDNRLLLDKDGKEVMSSMYIVFKVGNTVKLQDKVMIIKRNGADYSMPDKKWQIKKMSTIASFSSQFVEVYL